MGKGGLVEKWQAHILATQLGENGAQQTTTVERIQATANLFKSEGVEIDPLYNEALDEAAELRSRESVVFPAAVLTPHTLPGESL